MRLLVFNYDNYLPIWRLTVNPIDTLTKGHAKCGGRKVTETSVIVWVFLLKRSVVTVEFRPVEINTSSSAKNCSVSKN